MPNTDVHHPDTAETEHLTCFAGAMLGLGAKLLDRPKDLNFGEKFTQTCYWLVRTQLDAPGEP